MHKKILGVLTDCARLMTVTQSLSSRIAAVATMISESYAHGGRLYIFGNGGSAADAQHLAAEFVNRFLIERPPLPAMALTTDTSILTSISNDYGFTEVFTKQLKSLGRPGDVAWGISTSGSSPNVVKALMTARNLGLKTIAMTGLGGGQLRDSADVLLEVESMSTPRIQEVHITIGHIICELVDYLLFQRPGEVSSS